MTRRRIALPATPVVFVLLLAACAAPAASQPATTAASEPAAASAEPSAAGGGDAATVTISGFNFGEESITVAAGTEVTFVNEDTAGHTVTEGTDGTAAEGARFNEDVAGGASVPITFDEPGTYQVTCRIHPTMNMTVVVEG